MDFTTSTVPAFLEEGEVKCSAGLRRMLEAGVDAGHITFTSDGQGSLPAFDAQGRLRRLEVGRVTSLFAEVRDAVLAEGVPLETALRVITSNPARILKLRGKGAARRRRRRGRRAARAGHAGDPGRDRARPLADARRRSAGEGDLRVTRSGQHAVMQYARAYQSSPTSVRLCQSRPRFAMPHTLVVVMALVVLVLAASWVVPSGEYQRAKVETSEGARNVTVAGTYREVPKVYLGPQTVLESPIKGFLDGALLICFLLMIGGSFAIFQETGAVEFGIRRLTDAISRRPPSRGC